jgi:hypothetical protein
LLDCLGGRELRDQRVLGVNAAFRLGDWVDVCFFGDAKFYWWNREDLAKYRGMKFTCNEGVRHGHRSVVGEDGLHILRIRKFRGLDKDPRCVAWNKSSGAAAINVAVHLGASKIVLLGYDMRRVDGRKNWLPHEQEQTNQNPYEYMLGGFPPLAKALKGMKIPVMNATPGSALRVFPITTLDKVLNEEDSKSKERVRDRTKNTG